MANQSPGSYLRDTLKRLGMPQVELARRTGLSTKHINQVIQDRAPMSHRTAYLLERATGISSMTWNTLESVYQDALLRAMIDAEEQAAPSDAPTVAALVGDDGRTRAVCPRERCGRTVLVNADGSLRAHRKPFGSRGASTRSPFLGDLCRDPLTGNAHTPNAVQSEVSNRG